MPPVLQINLRLYFSHRWNPEYQLSLFRDTYPSPCHTYQDRPLSLSPSLNKGGTEEEWKDGRMEEWREGFMWEVLGAVNQSVSLYLRLNGAKYSSHWSERQRCGSYCTQTCLYSWFVCHPNPLSKAWILSPKLHIFHSYSIGRFLRI